LLVVSTIVVIALVMLKADLETYGEIRPDPGITEAFEKFQITPSLKYYLAGSREKPDAILGVEISFAVDERFWISLNPLDPRDMKRYISAMMNMYPEIMMPQGFALFSNTGRNVGMLFSFPGRITFIKFDRFNSVTIFPPRMPERAAPAGPTKLMMTLKI